MFSYLDSITLWHYNGTEAGAAVVKDVTMGSLLFAIIASMVAWALIRNLPGLLEVLVLSRLKMARGFLYAITTILNYAIIAIGAMTVFGSAQAFRGISYSGWPLLSRLVLVSACRKFSVTLFRSDYSV